MIMNFSPDVDVIAALLGISSWAHAKRSKIKVGKTDEKSIYPLSIFNKHTSVQLIIHLGKISLAIPLSYCSKELSDTKQGTLSLSRSDKFCPSCSISYHIVPAWHLLDTFLCFFLIQSFYCKYVQMYGGKDVSKQINRNFLLDCGGKIILSYFRQFRSSQKNSMTTFLKLIWVLWRHNDWAKIVTCSMSTLVSKIKESNNTVL